MTDNTPELKEIARHLKDIAQIQKEQLRLLKILNQTVLSSISKPSDTAVPEPTEAPVDEKSKVHVYGWSMAASVQREGGLCVGDLKVEQDDSYWIWTGDIWERVDLVDV